MNTEDQIKSFPSLQSLWGESLGRPLATANLIFLLIVLLALIFLPWVQTSRGLGRVTAWNPNDREQQIDAPIDGRIKQWLVTEGNEVQEGDPIAEMQDFDPDIIERLASERDALSQRLAASQKAATVAKRNLDRQRKLYEEGLTSRREYERAEIDYSGYLAAEATSSAELSRIDTRLSRQSRQLIRATRSGIISRILAQEGTEVIKTGQIIAKLVPKSIVRSAEIYLDAIDLPLIYRGQIARLQFEGWPAIQFSGWPSVAVGTFEGFVASVDPSVDQNGKFRVLILENTGKPWPEEQYLRQGMRARGWIQLGTVRLGYELWRNFNGFPASVEKPRESEIRQ